MKYRKLRIAWSVMWGVVAVLLCVLWVRSCFVDDFVQRVSEPELLTIIESELGSIRFSRVDYQNIPHFMPLEAHGWEYDNEKAETYLGIPNSTFEWNMANSDVTIRMPHWFLIAVSGIAAGLPWIGELRLRFSLRTLLVVTTMVAVGLGVVVWLTK